MMPDYARLYGPWALVLGGSEGLGRAIAALLAARGMNVALAARRQAPLEAAAASIAEAHGVETRTIVLDLADDAVIDQIEQGMKGDDVSFLVYNAAAEPYGAFIDLPIDDHLANIAVNITAPTRIVHHVGRQMAARGRGGIVLCSSLAAAAGLSRWVSYGASKAYGHILGEGLWHELGTRGVDACTLMVGTTWTESFQRTQQRLGGIFANGRAPADLPAGMALPQLPEDAAANLFAQIDREWLPTIFANPDDAARWTRMSAIEGKPEMIRYAAQAQEDWYRHAGSGA